MFARTDEWWWGLYSDSGSLHEECFTESKLTENGLVLFQKRISVCPYHDEKVSSFGEQVWGSESLFG